MAETFWDHSDDVSLPRASSSARLARPASAPALHTKERCHGCGLWKQKRVECTHCMTRANRDQAKRAQAKHVQQPLTPIGIGGPGGGAIVLTKGVNWSAATSTSNIHTKERCTSCGLWKHKDRRCAFCLKRINRAQAQLAQAAPPRSEFYHPHSRDRAAIIRGGLQRPAPRPANQTTSADFELRNATTAEMLSQASGRKAVGPGSYKSSNLYKTPSGLRKIVSQAREPRGAEPQWSSIGKFHIL